MCGDSWKYRDFWWPPVDYWYVLVEQTKSVTGTTGDRFDKVLFYFGAAFELARG